MEMHATSATVVPCDLCGSRESVFLLENGGARYAQCPHCGFIFTNLRRVNFAGENDASFTRAKVSGLKLYKFAIMSILTYTKSHEQTE